MSTFDALVHRYLDDRASLDPEELDALIAGLQAVPARAIALREQLMLDDLLGQKLAVDRRDFLAQVGQRLADYERGESEMDSHVAELRALAEAQIERPVAVTRGTSWMKYILAVSAALLMAAVLLAPRIVPGQRHVVARLQHVEGDVTVEQDGRPAQAAAASGNVLAGQRLVVSAGGSVTVAYPDGTIVAAEGGTQLSFAIDRASVAKEVRIDRGRLSASIARQSIGMRFVTPHAVATVLGTELRLHVTDEATQLDVTKGRVQFDHAGSRRSLDVRARESAIASADSLDAARRKWPNDRSSVAYLLSPFETLDPGQPLMVARNPDSGLMRDTPLKVRGAARLLDESLHFELSGGSLVSDDAGEDLRRIFAPRDALTLEIVFAPAAVDQTGIIAAFAAVDGQANFRLEQARGSLWFSLRADAEPPAATEIPLEGASGMVHVAVVCHGGELAAYVGGAEVARKPVSHAPFSAWLPGALTLGSDADGNSAWEGRIEAFVLHDRALAPGEVAASARTYRLLAGRDQ